MKILLTHFQIQDYGGIVNYTECLVEGMSSLGHHVDAIMFKNKGKSGESHFKDRSLELGWEESHIAEWMHQKSGWEGINQINYVTDKDKVAAIAEEYNLIIHVIPVPTCTKQTREDYHWEEIFSEINFQETKQIAVVHDGNMQKLYPHLLHVCKYLDGLVCVHDASFNSCNVLPLRRTFLPNPHNFDKSQSIPKIKDRKLGIVSLQTFKRWKRVDDLIRAIPFMDAFTDKTICGGGIEYCYMTSKTKCKPEYINGNGTPIWDEALNSGMEFLGYVDTEERDLLLKRNRLLIDPSWSKNYSKFGSHFNRVMVEAIAQGCVPVCTDLAMKDSLLFKANVNYLELPYDIDPKNYGKQIDKWLEDEDMLQEMQNNNIKLMEVFDKQNVAKGILEFAFGNSGEIGVPSLEFQNKADKKMSHFEGI